MDESHWNDKKEVLKGCIKLVLEKENNTENKFEEIKNC
jgi:hypothetical protein